MMCIFARKTAMTMPNAITVRPAAPADAEVSEWTTYPATGDALIKLASET